MGMRLKVKVEKGYLPIMKVKKSIYSDFLKDLRKFKEKMNKCKFWTN